MLAETLACDKALCERQFGYAVGTVRISRTPRIPVVGSTKLDWERLVAGVLTGYTEVTATRIVTSGLPTIHSELNIGRTSWRKNVQLSRTLLGDAFLLQPCVLHLGLLQDGNVGVGVFPESEEIV